MKTYCTILLLLLSLCCVLCPAQGEDDDVQIDYQGLYCAESAAATQEYIQQEPFTQLSPTDQHNHFISIYSFTEHSEIIQALIDGKIKLASDTQPNEEDIHMSPMEALFMNTQLSCEQRIAFAQQMMTQGAEVSNFAFNIACTNGEKELIAFCLQNGANVKAGVEVLCYLNPDEEFQCLDADASLEDLSYAAEYKAESELKIKECFDYLLAQGADVNSRDEDGVTPCHIAAASGNICMLKLLLQAGADITLCDNDGSTALHHAVYNDESPEETIAFLLQSGLDIEALTKDEDTPLLLACQLDNKAAMHALIAHGADARISINGLSPLYTALSCAIAHKDWEIFRIIYKEQSLTSIITAFFPFGYILLYILIPLIILIIAIIRTIRKPKA